MLDEGIAMVLLRFLSREMLEVHVGAVSAAVRLLALGCASARVAEFVTTHHVGILLADVAMHSSALLVADIEAKAKARALAAETLLLAQPLGHALLASGGEGGSGSGTTGPSCAAAHAPKLLSGGSVMQARVQVPLVSGVPHVCMSAAPSLGSDDGVGAPTGAPPPAWDADDTASTNLASVCVSAWQALALCFHRAPTWGEGSVSSAAASRCMQYVSAAGVVPTLLSLCTAFHTMDSASQCALAPVIQACLGALLAVFDAHADVVRDVWQGALPHVWQPGAPCPSVTRPTSSHYDIDADTRFSAGGACAAHPVLDMLMQDVRRELCTALPLLLISMVALLGNGESPAAASIA
ncbi:MAG: hypothetical protein EOO41_05345, partial [Methanobacteriota archaeon]